MMLKEEMLKSGGLFFRFRSYIPITILPILAFEVFHFSLNSQAHWSYHIWLLLCGSISLSGLALRIMTVGFVPEGTSGRNTKRQSADELNTTGTYSIVRHPLYLANFIITLGFIATLQSILLICSVTVLFYIYYERIVLAEENFLLRKFGGEFIAWTQKVPTFIPDLRKWKKPEKSFSLKTIIRREYHGFFAIIIIFSTFEILVDYVALGVYEKDPIVNGFLMLGLFGYVAIRLIVKCTPLLMEEGRF